MPLHQGVLVVAVVVVEVGVVPQTCLVHTPCARVDVHGEPVEKVRSKCQSVQLARGSTSSRTASWELSGEVAQH